MYKFIALMMLVSSTFWSYAQCPGTSAGWPLLKRLELQHRGGWFISQPASDFLFVIEADDTQFDSPAPDAVLDFVMLPANSSTTGVCVYRKQALVNSHTQYDLPIEVSAVPSQTVSLLLKEANTLWQLPRKSAKAGAISLYQQAFEKLVYSHPHFAESLGLMVINALFTMFEYDAAIGMMQHLYALPQLTEHSHHTLTTINAMIALNRNEYQRAITLLLPLQKSLKEPMPLTVNQHILLYSLLAEAYLYSADNDTGETFINRGEALAARPEYVPYLSTNTLSLLYDNAGFLHLRLAEAHISERRAMLKKALEYEYRALTYAIQGNDKKQQIVLHSNIAWMLKSMAAFDSAQRNYLIALSLLYEYSDADREALIYGNLGQIYASLGLNSKANIYFLKAIELLAEQAPLRSARYACLAADVSSKDNRANDVSSLMGTCTQAFANSSEHIDERALGLLLHLEISRGSSDGAAYDSIIVKRLQSLLKEITDNIIKTRVQAALSAYYFTNDDVTMADTLINKAHKTSLLSADPTLIAKVNEQAMVQSIAAGNANQAKTYAEQAIKHIRKTMTNIEHVELGPAWSEQVESFFANWTGFLLEQNNQQAAISAFAASELMRGYNLRKALNTHKSPVDAQIQFKLDRISELSSQAIGGGSQRTKSLDLSLSIETDLIKLRRQSKHESLSKDELASYYRGEVASAASRQDDYSSLDLKTIQSRLNPTQAALHYHIGSNKVGVFVITASQFFFVDLGQADSLLQSLEETRVAVSARQNDALSKLSALSLKVLPDALPSDVSELLIVPHRELNHVPFAALTLPSNGTETSSTIGESLSLVVLPSLTTWAQRRDESVTLKANELIILADPFLASTGPHDSPDETWSTSLPPLHWSRQEAQRLHAEFLGMPSRIFLGRQATRANLLSEGARNARILHIATHGYYNEEMPDQVGFTLATQGIDGKQDPGFVTFAELNQYKFNNTLVIVNGCQTAIGKTRGSEGLISMARGFLMSGAENVIATLWPVSDRASAVFMHHFYQSLGTQQNISSALMSARREMRNNPRFSHPFYWAAYTHYALTDNAHIELATQREF